MTNELTPKKNFEERMRDRIRKDIGSLLTNEELEAMVRRCVQTIFFEPRVETDSWGRKTQDDPPLLHEIVKDLVNQRVVEMASKYIEQHEDTVTALIKDAIDTGLGQAVIRAFQMAMHSPLASFSNEVQAKFDSIQRGE